jgi:hypothetical protein
MTQVFLLSKYFDRRKNWLHVGSKEAGPKPRWSPQKRPYEVTSKPAIAIGRRRDCFLPCLGVSRQVAIVAVWVGTYVQMSLAAKNGAILAGLWRCFLWPHATTSGISPRSGPDDSLFGLSEVLLGQFRRNCAPGRAGLVISLRNNINIIIPELFLLRSPRRDAHGYQS